MSVNVVGFDMNSDICEIVRGLFWLKDYTLLLSTGDVLIPRSHDAKHVCAEGIDFFF